MHPSRSPSILHANVVARLALCITMLWTYCFDLFTLLHSPVHDIYPTLMSPHVFSLFLLSFVWRCISFAALTQIVHSALVSTVSPPSLYIRRSTYISYIQRPSARPLKYMPSKVPSEFVSGSSCGSVRLPYSSMLPWTGLDSGVLSLFL